MFFYLKGVLLSYIPQIGSAKPQEKFNNIQIIQTKSCSKPYPRIMLSNIQIIQNVWVYAYFELKWLACLPNQHLNI